MALLAKDRRQEVAELQSRIEELETQFAAAKELLKAEESAHGRTREGIATANRTASAASGEQAVKHEVAIRELLTAHEIENAKNAGAVDALTNYVKDTVMRLGAIEAGHAFHIGGTTVAHDGSKHILWECLCGVRISGPEGFIEAKASGE